MKKLIEAPDLNRGKGSSPGKPTDNKELVDALKTITEKAQETDALKKMMQSELDSIRKDIAKLDVRIQTGRVLDGKEVQSLTADQKELDSKVGELDGKVKQVASQIDKLAVRPFPPSQEEVSSLKEATDEIKKNVEWLLDEVDRINNAKIKEKKPQPTYMVNEGLTSSQKTNLDELSGGGVTALHSHAGGGGAGDMTKAVYDPAAKNAQLGTAAELTTHAAIAATASVQGHATATQITKLDGIESAATKYPDTGEQAFLDADHNKLDGIAAGANLYVHPNHSGEVTSAADGAQTIANDAVTYAKMQNVSATDKVLGRSTAGAGDVEEIACTAAGRALLDDANAAAQLVTLGDAAAAVAAVAAAGFTLADAKFITFTDPSASHTYSGFVKSHKAHEAMVFGDVCFINGDEEMAKALGSAIATMPACCMAVASIDANASGLFLFWGFVHDDTFAFAHTGGAANVIFVSEATAGLATTTDVVGSNGVVQPIGHALATDEGFFNFTGHYIELVA